MRFQTGGDAHGRSETAAAGFGGNLEHHFVPEVVYAPPIRGGLSHCSGNMVYCRAISEQALYDWAAFENPTRWPAAAPCGSTAAPETADAPGRCRRPTLVQANSAPPPRRGAGTRPPSTATSLGCGRWLRCSTRRRSTAAARLESCAWATSCSPAFVPPAKAGGSHGRRVVPRRSVPTEGDRFGPESVIGLDRNTQGRGPAVPRQTWRRLGAWSYRGCGCRPQAAKHRGVSVDAYTAQLLEQHLQGEGRRADELVAVLQSWMDEDDAGEQRATGDYLVHALDEDRLSERPFFPAEQKGATWRIRSSRSTLDRWAW